MSEIKLKLAAGTHVGLIRKNNEDNFVVNKDLVKQEWLLPQASETISIGKYGTLLVVADGMGGTNAGEVASAIAIDTMQEVFTPEKLGNIISEDAEAISEETIRSFLIKAIQTADLNIVNRSNNDSSTQGMGTTIVVAWILGNKAYIAWCGDSRCYVFNTRCGFSRLSKDHSYVQELVDAGKLDAENAFNHPYSNIITRSLGDSNNRAQADFRSYDLENDDILLLCTDGLCGLCQDEDIMQVIEANLEDMTQCKDELIALALAAGGYDNVTVALCHHTREGVVQNPNLNNTVYIKPSRHLFRSLLIVLTILALICGFIYDQYPQQCIEWKNKLFPVDSISTALVQEDSTGVKIEETSQDGKI